MFGQMKKYLACAAILGATTPYASAETVTLRFASPLGAKMSYGVGADWWMSQITERTGGKVQFRAFHDGSLVAGAEVLPALQSGRVDAAIVAAVYNPSDFPLWTIATLPFMSDNSVAHMLAINSLYETDETFRGEFDKLNLVMSLFQPVAPAATGAPEPITSPEDYRGKKMRAVGLVAKALSAIGVEPVAIAPGEIYESVERGVLDGFASVGFDGIPSLSLQEVAPHITNPRTGTFSSIGIGFNSASWAGLPDDVKRVIEQVSDEYMNAKAAEVLSQVEVQACDAIEKANGSVTIFTDEQIASWRDGVRNAILVDWRATAVKAAGDEAKVAAMEKTYMDALAEKAASVTSYRDGMTICAERLKR
jgi:TRAP-type C4-dicarboxylate transport system substrate-binding protein